jgi:Zn-dependent alcohol dehydrogenase
MKAALFESSGGRLRLERLTIEDPRPGHVLVRIAGCGVCHSDLSLVDGIFPCPLPIVLGHEAAGVVEAVGAAVTDLTVGDHVVLTACPPCGACYWCVRGEASLCVASQPIQTNTYPDGTTGLSLGEAVVYRGLGVAAFAEYAVVSARAAVKIPAEVSLEVASVIGCAVQTGVGAVLNTARVEEGATVLVMGLGGIGLSIVQGARLAGAARIIASDPVAHRREAAARFGATDVIDPSAEDVLGRALALTGVGVDYAFDAAGRARVVEMGIAATRPGGTTVCVGAPALDETITIPTPALFTVTERKLIGCVLGSCNALRDIPRLVALWQSGRLDLDGLVTRRRPLAEINEAMDDLRAGRGIRTVLAG